MAACTAGIVKIDRELFSDAACDPIGHFLLSQPGVFTENGVVASKNRPTIRTAVVCCTCLTLTLELTFRITSHLPLHTTPHHTTHTTQHNTTSRPNLNTALNDISNKIDFAHPPLARSKTPILVASHGKPRQDALIPAHILAAILKRPLFERTSNRHRLVLQQKVRSTLTRSQFGTPQSLRKINPPQHFHPDIISGPAILRKYISIWPCLSSQTLLI